MVIILLIANWRCSSPRETECGVKYISAFTYTYNSKYSDQSRVFFSLRNFIWTFAIRSFTFISWLFMSLTCSLSVFFSLRIVLLVHFLVWSGLVGPVTYSSASKFAGKLEIILMFYLCSSPRLDTHQLRTLQVHVSIFSRSHSFSFLSSISFQFTCTKFLNYYRTEWITVLLLLLSCGFI